MHFLESPVMFAVWSILSLTFLDLLLLSSQIQNFNSFICDQYPSFSKKFQFQESPTLSFVTFPLKLLVLTGLYDFAVLYLMCCTLSPTGDFEQRKGWYHLGSMLGHGSMQIPDIKQGCTFFARRRKRRHMVTPLLFCTFQPPEARFAQVHHDIVSLLPCLCSYCYLLTCVDDLTRWPNTTLISSMTAETGMCIYWHVGKPFWYANISNNGLR